MRRWMVPVVAVGVLVLVCAGLGATLTASDLSAANPADREAAAAEVPTVGLDVRRPLPPPGTVGGAGVIEPAERPSSWAAEVGGVIDAVLVAEGQRVEAGQPLVALRSELQRAEVDAASADVAAAVAEASSTAARAASSAEVAARTEALYARGAATPDERERAARARQVDAEAARASSSRVAVARARLASAQVQLDQRVVRAPFAAEVLQVPVLAGEYLAPGAVAVVAGDTTALTARVDVDERDAVGIAVGQRAVARVEGVAREVPATVASVARRVGRKNVRSDDPTERRDARFVEVVLRLDEAPPVPIGVRVEGFVRVDGE